MENSLLFGSKCLPDRGRVPIVVKQKGLDYFESIYSHAQIAIIMTAADYKYISENQSYNYL